MAEWVMVVAANVDPTEPRPHVVCQRCGERVITKMPIRVSTYVALSRSFIEMHEACEAKP